MPITEEKLAAMVVAHMIDKCSLAGLMITNNDGQPMKRRPDHWTVYNVGRPSGALLSQAELFHPNLGPLRLPTWSGSPPSPAAASNRERITIPWLLSREGKDVFHTPLDNGSSIVGQQRHYDSAGEWNNLILDPGHNRASLPGRHLFAAIPWADHLDSVKEPAADISSPCCHYCTLSSGHPRQPPGTITIRTFSEQTNQRADLAFCPFHIYYAVMGKFLQPWHNEALKLVFGNDIDLDTPDKLAKFIECMKERMSKTLLILTSEPIGPPTAPSRNSAPEPDLKPRVVENWGAIGQPVKKTTYMVYDKVDHDWDDRAADMVDDLVIEDDDMPKGPVAFYEADPFENYHEPEESEADDEAEESVDWDTDDDPEELVTYSTIDDKAGERVTLIIDNVEHYAEFDSYWWGCTLMVLDKTNTPVYKQLARQDLEDELK
ncbi:hypothetical protein B0H66DRAFT_536688 [Apodospora peruviana]|uniref:Uncharacterized protein n=1 Tax=Apodospora peruviana TaxID=516989 RepID=A0AAE0HV14_9PEZI|nr:hypothetical protein B0H66DRAFT_536688 [Apodospora peruviana]